MWRLALLLVLAPALAACGNAPESDATPHEVTPVSPAKPHIPHLDREVDVFVGPDRVATLAPLEVERGVELDAFLASHPIDTWESLIVFRDTGDDEVQWLEPANNFKDLVPLIYLDGDRPAAGFFSPADVAKRTNAVVEASKVTAVRVQLAKHRRTPLEEVAAGCQPEPKGELQVLAIPEHWKGTTYQFNIPMHWKTDMHVDLGAGVGKRIGVLTQDAVEWSERCIYDLYRRADNKGRRTIFGKLRELVGGCVDDATYELTCSGDKLLLLSYYPNGLYVERGLLAAVSK